MGALSICYPEKISDLVSLIIYNRNAICKKRQRNIFDEEQIVKYKCAPILFCVFAPKPTKMFGSNRLGRIVYTVGELKDLTLHRAYGVIYPNFKQCWWDRGGFSLL